MLCKNDLVHLASLISCDSDSSDSEDTPIPHSTLQVCQVGGETSVIFFYQL